MNSNPHVPTPTGIEAVVCEDIAKRQALGIHKYGRTVADNPLELRAWLKHAYEEALDLSIYLRRAMAEIDANNTPKRQPIDEERDEARRQLLNCIDAHAHAGSLLRAEAERMRRLVKVATGDT
jgi:hypothetical protein